MRIHLVVNISGVIRYREPVKRQKVEKPKLVKVNRVKEQKIKKIQIKRRGFRKYKRISKRV